MKEAKARINQQSTIESVIAKSKEFMAMYESKANSHNVSISSGNAKLGSIDNVSLPPVITCGANCKSCVSYCYAIRLYLKYGFDRKDGKLNPWLMNYIIYLTDSKRYFDEISKSCFNSRFFRWHTSGDIADYNYSLGMVLVAISNPHCEFLAFTKQYHIINEFIEKNTSIGSIPSNLHIIFSISPEVECNNPYNMPECHINFEDAFLNTFKACKGIVYRCGGNCTECIKNKCGCFNLKNNDVVLINQH